MSEERTAEPATSRVEGRRAREIDEVLFRSAVAAIGRFRATPETPTFHDSGPAERYMFVFPRSSVIIRHEGRPSFAADRCTVAFYNRGQRYTREALDPRGDASEWFSVRPDVLSAVMEQFDPGSSDRQEQHFQRPFGTSDPSTYMLQRFVTGHVASHARFDALFVDESVLELLGRVLRRSFSPPEHRGETRRSADLAERVRRYLATSFTDNIQLEDIARAVGSSIFHLCRVFRAETGRTIHTYRLQLRLRRSLELVAESGADLTRVAFQLGFSSHSHFTATFRRAFSITPSSFRRTASDRQIREMAAGLG